MDGMATDKDWQRLAGFVRERRTDLGLTQEDVRSAGGPSTATMRLIEGGLQSNYQPVILRRLEDALRWEHGSVRRILDGGNPVPLSEPGASLAARATLATGTAAGAGAATASASVTSAVVIAAISPIEAEVAGQIRDGIPFTDPAEAALWAMELTPHAQRIREIAALRSVRARPPRHDPARQTGLTGTGT